VSTKKILSIKKNDITNYNNYKYCDKRGISVLLHKILFEWDRMPKYRVPKEVSAIARRALEYNRSLPPSRRAAQKVLKDGSRVEGTGVRTAKRLISGSIDADQMILMRAWFARHGESPLESKKRKDKTSKAAIAWALWGGNPARTFVSKKLKELGL
tara:strand:- start:400 stop:867 length:468 start_codon:yes stop_codon:yes gene_type:complete